MHRNYMLNENSILDKITIHLIEEHNQPANFPWPKQTVHMTTPKQTQRQDRWIDSATTCTLFGCPSSWFSLLFLQI